MPTSSEVEQLILDLCVSERRENALLQLSKIRRELFLELGPLIMKSFGTLAAILQEISAIYPALSPPNLTPEQSFRVCNALSLLQCVASHPQTRPQFLDTHYPAYLYPFLNTTSREKPFEHLRLTTLGVIGAMVKEEDDLEVIRFLLSTEMVPLCLRSMEAGGELTKTVATFIVHKILLDESGLYYVFVRPGRFYSVARVLGHMTMTLSAQPSLRLLKHIIKCYLRMSEHPRGCEALKTWLPRPIADGTASFWLQGDPATQICLQQLLNNVRATQSMIQFGSTI